MMWEAGSSAQMWGIARGQMPGIFSPISGIHHRRENLFWSSLVAVFWHYGAFSEFQSYFSVSGWHLLLLASLLNLTSVLVLQAAAQMPRPLG